MLTVLCWLNGPSKASGAVVITTPGSTSSTNGYLSGIISGVTTNTRVHFEYGSDLNYGNFTSPKYLSSSQGSQIVGDVVQGLAPGTYHYRLMATEIGNTSIATGNDMTFTISGPTAATLAPSLINSSSVILNGVVNPNGVATTAYFQYGSTTNYSNQTIVTNLSAGLATCLVTTNLGGLTLNQILHYRIVASNSVGVSMGADMTFTNQPALLVAYPQAVGWSVGNPNPPVIQLSGSGASPLIYTIVKSPRFGTIVTNVSGGFYTTNSGKCQYQPYAFSTFNGTDSFTFKVSNGANSSAEATVCIVVPPVNHAPHAEDQTVKVLQNTSYNGYLTGDDDADVTDPYANQTNYSDPNRHGYHYSPLTPNLTYTIVGNVLHGTLITTNLPSFIYTPNTNYVGTDSFTFKVNDGTLDSTNFGTVSIVVATNVGTIRPGFDKFSFGRADDQSFPVSLTGTNSDWLGRDLLLQFSSNNFPSNYFTQFFANNNGNLTFKSVNSNYIGMALPTATNGPMIAPYWADVFTSNSLSGVMTYGMQYVGGRLAVGVTWTNVMTFGITTNSNSFQVILIDRSDVQVGDFDIEFNYDKIQWLNGTASPGTYPSIGFDEGNGLYYNLPGSMTGNVVDTSTNGLIHNSNLIPPVPGRYFFRISQPLAVGQSLLVLANTTNTVPLNPAPLPASGLYGIIAGPTNGTLSGTGPIQTYRPNTNYIGPDRFTFIVDDGMRFASNTVTLSVVQSLSIPGTNATLSNLTFSTNSLIPAFAPAVLTYVCPVSKSVSNADLIASCADTNATIQLQTNGGPFSAGVWGTITNRVLPNLGTNIIGFKVTSADGKNTQTYTVNIIPLNTNANLASLTLNPGSLTPVFNPTNLAYNSTVANSVSNTDLMTVSVDPGATLQVQANGGTLSAPVSGVLSNRVALNFGSNIIKIKVTAPDGANIQTNTLSVIRLLSNDATLSSVTASGTALTLNGATYSGQFATTVTNTFITAIANDPNATLTLDGSPLASGVPSGSIPLPFGNTSHILNVTAQNGTTITSYTVNFVRQLNTNANLANLTCSSGLLSPAFSSNVTTYSLTVSNNVSSINVTPTSADTVYATIQAQVNGGSYVPVSSGSASGALGLNIGTNTISVAVTAQNGITIKTYTLAVTRQAGVAVVTTQPASSVIATGALLNASVNPNGTATVFSFQYGPDTNYTKSTAPTDIGSGTNPQSVGTSIGGLLPGTTNHFRVVASNSFGVVLGADMSFTNLADVPVVTNVTADGIAHSTVSLHGAVNPNGAGTLAYFQYGQSTNYGSSTIVTNLGGGTTLLSLDAGLTNLLAGKTYHYQLMATNSVGTNSSGDMTFTLLAPPLTTGFGLQTDGSFQLQFSGGAGLSYTLQTSTDMTNWMNFTNLLAETNGLFIFNDATATNYPIRFYRLSQP